MLKLFFKEPDPKELVRKWQATLRAEQRGLERQVREIQMEEKKVQKSIKEAAKRGDMGACKSMAKEILHSRKAVSRLYTNRAQMMGIGTALTEQLAMLKVAGCMQRSSEVMKAVNVAMKAPELQKTMMEMSKEMSKAGLIEEMMSDALDDALGAEDEEEETEAEVDRVIAEVAGETLASLPAAQRAKLPQQRQAEAAPDIDEDEELQARLNAVKM